MDEFLSTVIRRKADAYFEAAIQEAGRAGADAVLLTGDIVSFPSEANLAFVKQKLAQLNVPVMFTPGNHDWQFLHLEPWNEETRIRNMPLLADFMPSGSDVQVLTIGEVRLIAVDNSTYQVHEDQVIRIKQLLEDGVPTLLFMHIPVHTPRLTADVVRRWGAPIVMGGEGWTESLMGKWEVEPAGAATMEFCNLLRSDAFPNLGAVCCGHVHIPHVDELVPGRFQFVTQPGYENGYRIIRLIPM